MQERPNKIEHIYLVPDDFVLNVIDINDDKINNIKKSLSPSYKNDYQTILNGLDYLSLESINIIEKNKKENIKKLNLELLVTIFKCMGFNLIYCPQIAERTFSDVFILVKIKYDNIPENYFTNSVVIKQNIFFDIAKNVTNNITDGHKCHLKKYFTLSYHIISKSI
jgi:hypothetical protein